LKEKFNAMSFEPSSFTDNSIAHSVCVPTRYSMSWSANMICPLFKIKIIIKKIRGVFFSKGSVEIIVVCYSL